VSGAVRHDRAAEVRTGEVRTGEVREGEVSVRQIRTSQVSVAKIYSWFESESVDFHVSDDRSRIQQAISGVRRVWSAL